MKKITAPIIFGVMLHCFLTNIAIAQVSLPNVCIAIRIDEPIALNGILDEKCWGYAPRITNFTQRELNEGEPITERTEVAIVYTTDKLFLGVWCYESEPDKITAKYMQRDFPYWLDDNFEVIFDTYHDKRNGYIFVINPNGARSDVQITDEGKGFNINWNGVWDAAVMIADSGWFAEIEIPFSTLKFTKDSIQIWGMNLERNIRRKQEQAFWQGWSRDYDFEHVSHAGKLIGLSGIASSEIAELKTYCTAGLELNRDGSSGSLGKLGGDINFPLTSTMKLNVTLNTDFAQVESDRAQINISRFALYYPEKRDFFLDGKDFFEFNILSRSMVFYSRRIGITDKGQAPIIAGLRLTGKAGSSNIGAMTIQTDEHNGEPSENFTVLRYRHNVLEKSSVGMILTAKNSQNTYNYVMGADAKYYTSNMFQDKNFNIEGSIAQSHTKGTDQGKNLAYRVVAQYPNNDFYGRVGLFSVQKNFNPASGFLERNNFQLFEANFAYSINPSGIPWLHRIMFAPVDLSVYFTEDTGELESMIFGAMPLMISAKSGEYVSIAFNRQFDRVDQSFRISDEVEIPAGKHWWTSVIFNAGTYSGRNLSASMYLEVGEYYNGKGAKAGGEFSWSVNKHIRISGDYMRAVVDFPDGIFTADDFGGRIDAALNPKLNSGLYCQWNNMSKMMIVNFRFHWIPVVGSDFYLALNQFVSTANRDFSLENTAILSKFVWRISI